MMHIRLMKTMLQSIRKRVSEGDHPTTPAYSVEQLEDLILSMNQKKLSDAQITHMAERFLGWKLPENFNPDGGISFEPLGNKGTAHEFKRDPSGTNLLDFEQAKNMIIYIAEGMPDENAADSSP